MNREEQVGRRMLKTTGQCGQWLLGGLALVACVACGGKQKPAEEPIDPAVASLEQPEPEEREVTPTSSEVKRASDLIKQEKYEEAAQILAKETKSAPKDAQAAFFYGVALEGLGKAAEAEAEYRRAIGLDVQLIESSQNLSALLLQQEKYTDALAVTDKALQHAPKDGPLLANRALALDMLGRPESVGAYEQLLEVKPDDQANRFNYAVALYVNKRPDDAKAQLAKINSTDLELLVDVEKLQVALKDFAGCISTWDRVVSGAPSADAYAHRARCRLMAGDPKTAEADLKAALGLDEKSAIAHYYYGMMLQKNGKKAEAKAHFQAAVAADPNSDFGKAAKAEL